MEAGEADGLRDLSSLGRAGDDDNDANDDNDKAKTASEIHVAPRMSLSVSDIMSRTCPI